MLDDAGRRWIRLTVRTRTLECDVAIPEPPPDNVYSTVRKLVGLPDDVGLDGTVADAGVLTDTSASIQPTPNTEIAIAVETGPDCGRVLPLGDASVTVGRASDNTITIADPRVSRHQLIARYDPAGLKIMPVATTNPLCVDGTPTAGTVTLSAGQLLTIGSTGLRIVTAIDRGRPKPHAPPQASSQRSGADGDTVLDVPTPPDPPRPRSLSVAALLVPVVVAGGLVALTHSWMYLSLCAFGPMTALATYFTDKRNGKRRSRSDRRTYRRARARFDDELAATLAAERSTLDRRYPDLAAEFPTDGDRTVRLGTADVPASVTLSGPHEAPNTAANSDPDTGEGAGPPVLSAVPVGLNLAENVDRSEQERRRDIAIAGEPATAGALARAVVLQLCRKNDTGPLRLVLADPDSPRWAWTRWLPHRRAGPSAESTVVFVANTTRASIPDEPGHLLVIRPAEGPDEAVVSCADGNFARPGGAWPGRLPLGKISLDLVSIRTAEAWARQLGRSGSEDGAPAGIPSSVRLGGLIRTDDASLADRWRKRTPATSCAIGRAATGTLMLDLVRDGPHIMIAGTTGAGKSELLQTLVFSLAAGNDPRDLQFVLFDFKGGSGLRFAAELPHTVGTVTDLDSHLALRAFTSLQAELRRRERVFAAAGVQEFDELDRASRAGGRGDVPARLVIVIDEFRVLAEEQPDLLADVVRMVSVGRSLGVHLVLATQRPAGIVSADMQANINARISLRVRDVADSREVIDAPDAARLSADLPGRAFLRTGGDSLLEFQTARTEIGSASPPPAAEPRLLLPSDPLWRHADRPAASTSQPVDIAGFRRAAGPSLTLRRPWLPPLPDAVTVDELAEPAARHSDRQEGQRSGQRAGTNPSVPLGLGDDPAAAARLTVAWTPATDGNLMLLGTTRSGRTETLRVAASAFASSPAHVYVLDAAGGLSALEGFSAVGARVPLTEPDRAVRVIERVQQEIVRTDRAGDAAPIILIIDGWETWQPVLEGYDAAAIDALVTVSRTGPGTGIYVLVSGDRPLAVSKLGSTIGNKVLLRQSDRSDLLLHGVAKAAIPRNMPAGRGLAVGTFDGCSRDALEVQLARATPALHAAAAARQTPAPFTVKPLPAVIGDDRLGPARAGRIPIGIGGDDLAPLSWNTARHFLIAGPAGSGRTTALAVIARQCALAGIDVWTPSDDDEPGSDRPLVLIDDIDSLAPTTERELADLVRAESLVVVASGSTDRLASAFTGLAATVKSSRHGILLSPSRPMDGEVFGVRVRVPPAGPPGRGLYFDSARPVPVVVAGTHRR